MKTIALAALIALSAATILHAQGQPRAAPPAPTSLVLIVCKGHVEPWSTPDEAANAEFTHAENWKWDYPLEAGGKMLCRRIELPMIDPDEGKPLNGGVVFALHPDFSDPSQCMGAGVQAETAWDKQNHGWGYQVWRIGCPTKIWNIPDDGSPPYIIGYQMPDCGHFETIVCDLDTSI